MKEQHPFEPLVEQLVNDIVRTVENLPKAPMPFGAVKLSQAEQLERYMQQRADPAAWTKLIQEKGWNTTLRYAKRMESLLSRHQVSEVMNASTATDTR